MENQKINIEIEITLPDDFSVDSKSEIFQLECDIKERFEEITGYRIKNIFINVVD